MVIYLNLLLHHTHKGIKHATIYLFLDQIVKKKNNRLHAPIKLRKRNLQRNLKWVKSKSVVEPVLVIGNTKAVPRYTIHQTSSAPQPLSCSVVMCSTRDYF
ncbi:hypothetical protein Hanom_Chr04g00302861 [Helianthus anomalus]